MQLADIGEPHPGSEALEECDHFGALVWWDRVELETRSRPIRNPDAPTLHRFTGGWI